MFANSFAIALSATPITREIIPPKVIDNKVIIPPNEIKLIGVKNN